jgi:imidazolonepropionase-like amidohydrolase
MRVRLIAVVAIAASVGACRSLPVPRAADEAVVAGTQLPAQSRFTIYKLLNPIGTETDTRLATSDGGSEAKAVFSFKDRGTDVTLAARYRLAADGTPRSYAAWGEVARGMPIDDEVRPAGDGFVVRHRDRAARTVKAPEPVAMASGYAPMLGQELLLERWVARGRPARLALLPEGEARIHSRGQERYPLDGKTITLEHLAIDGLVWGREDAWLDERGRLAAAVTRDAEFDHIEAARPDYAPLIEALVARAGADAVAALAEAARGAASNDSGIIALEGVRLVDTAGGAPIDDAVIVWDGDRIVAAGPRVSTPLPAGAHRLDGRGKTVIPGLWDMHAHVTQVEQLAAYLAAGVTTVRDLGNILEFITALRDSIDSGHGFGPRIIVDGRVDGSGKRGHGLLRIDRPADIAPMIERLQKAGCTEVKVYSSVAPDLVPLLVAEAHRRGMRVTGHVPIGMNASDVIDAGFDSINHITSLLTMVVPNDEATRRKLSRAEQRRRVAELDVRSPAMTALADKLVAKQTLLDPTLAVFELFTQPAAELRRREPGLAKIPAALRGSFPGVSAEDAATSAAVFRSYMALLGELHRRGVPVVAGTDQSVLGHSLHRELELYVAAGFTPLEALQSATVVPARALGRDRELGSIGPGKRADLLVLDGDPLADIRNTRKVALVVARGRVYRPHELWSLAGFTP